MTSDSGNTKPLRKAAGIIISLFLAALFLYIALYNVDFSSVINIISRASITWILIFIITQFISHIVRAFRWKIILKSVKPDASVINLFGSLMVGYGVNCIIPRLGEISRAVTLGRWENISRSSLLGTVILERIIDSFSFLAAIIISAFIWNGNIYESFPWLKSSLYIVTFGMVLITIFLLVIIKLKQKFSDFAIKYTARVSVNLSLKVEHILDMLIIGFSSLKGTRNYVFTFLLTVVILGVYALSSYSGFFIINMQKGMNVNFGMAWVLMSLSAIGTIIPTPGGTGSYHALTKSVLVLLFGFAEEISVAYAFITHTISYLLFLITGLIFFFWLDGKYYARSGKHEKLRDLFATEQEEL